VLQAVGAQLSGEKDQRIPQFPHPIDLLVSTCVTANPNAQPELELPLLLAVTVLINYCARCILHINMMYTDGTNLSVEQRPYLLICCCCQPLPSVN
jgi:hypothetical protein